jgi:hypothetical protein
MPEDKSFDPMNPSELSSRSSRKIEIGGDLVALHREEALHPPHSHPAASPAAPASTAQPAPAPAAEIPPLNEPPVTVASPDPVPEIDASHLAEEIAQLRHALALLLARETGQDIAIFESPVVNNTRLCAIADNIHHRRHWAA